MALTRLTLAELRDQQARHWAAFDADENRVGWFDWEREVAATLLAAGLRVLVVGTGSGRDLVPFVAAGCAVTGIEPCGAPLARAAARLQHLGMAATLHQAYFEDSPVDGVFDLVWCSWFSYAYIPDSRRRIAALRWMRSHLTPNAAVVVSVPPGGPPRSRVTDLVVTISRLWPGDWRFERGDVLGDESGAGEPRFEHRFRRGEVAAELLAAGFAVEGEYSTAEATVAVARPRHP